MASPNILIFYDSRIGVDSVQDPQYLDAHAVAVALWPSRTAAIELPTGHNSPYAIWIQTSIILLPEYEELSSQVINYAWNGGTVIIGASFMANLTPRAFNRWMVIWGMPWRHSRLADAEVYLQVEMADRIWLSYLQNSYAHRQTFITGVAYHDMWYLPASELNGYYDTPVAMTMYGEGRVGWVGEVRGSWEKHRIAFAMMRVRILSSN